jgi:single-strand DNA-binding protein
MARGSVNKAIILGNLGADPEIRTTSGGQNVANFRVATNRTWTDRSGQRQEQTEWHNIVVWGKLAGIVEQYLKKGDQVYVEGRLQTRSWEDQNGQQRWTTEIVAQEMTMLGGSGGGASGGQRRGGRDSSGGGYDEDSGPDPVTEEDDDVPF